MYLSPFILKVGLAGSLTGLGYGVLILCLSFTNIINKVQIYPNALIFFGAVLVLMVLVDKKFRRSKGFEFLNAWFCTPRSVKIFLLAIVAVTLLNAWFTESYQGEPKILSSEYVLMRDDQVLKVLTQDDYSRIVGEHTRKFFAIGNLFYCLFTFLLWPRNSSGV